MNNHIIRILDNMSVARNNFFRRYHAEQTIISYLQSENHMIRLINSLVDNTAASILASIITPTIGHSVWYSAPAPSISVEAVTDAYAPGEEDTCTICQNNILTSERCCRIRRCRHSFHVDCITPWFRRSHQCPVCREDVRLGATNQTSNNTNGGTGGSVHSNIQQGIFV